MFFAKEKLTTAIDISDNFIKVVTISTDKGEKKLYALDSTALPTDKDKDIAKEVRSIISKNRLAKSLFLVSFPRHLVTIRNVRLPAANEEEVRNMVELQAVKYLPYSQEEMVVSYTIIDTTKDGYTNVMLILTQRKSVDRYLEIFKYAGVSIEKIALSSEGLLNWYLGLKVDDQQPTALIDLDRYHTHIQIIKDKKMVFSRSVSFDTIDPDSDMTVLLREIRLSFDSFVKEQDARVSRIILSGSQDYSSHFSPYLADNLSVKCERLEQLQNIKAKETADKYLPQFKSVSYTYLLGIASEPEKLAMNLLPHDIIDKKREQTLKNELIKTSVLFLTVAVAAFGVVEKKINDKRVYLKNINARLQEMEPEVKRLSELAEGIELIQNQIMFQGSSIDILRELYGMLPGDISLTLFEFEDKERILLRGTARDLSGIFELLPVLEKSPYFKNVKINYATKRTFKEKEFSDFEIVCALR